MGNKYIKIGPELTRQFSGSKARGAVLIPGRGTKILYVTAAAAKSLQSCPTLCDPIDGSPPGSPVPGILQARTLEWVAISFSTCMPQIPLDFTGISEK